MNQDPLNNSSEDYGYDLAHEVPAGPDRRDITHAHLSYEHRAGHPADHGTDYGSDEAHDL